MALRKWLVRGLVFAILGGLGTGAFVYLRWTDPAVVRQMVVEQLSAQLPGASVTLDAARLRLLGGIAIQELRLVRRDDADRTDVFYVPSGVLYHDKEQLARGSLAIRKIELHRPRIRVVRGADGTWNMKGILGPVDLSKTIPTMLLQQATIFFEDRTESSMPVLEVKDVNLTLLNDPLPTVHFHGAGQTEVAGKVLVRGSWQRASGEMAIAVDVPTVPVGPPLVQRLAAYAPQLAGDARHLEGTGTFQARFHYRPESQQWDHDLRAQLTKARFQHALLPLPLEDLEAAAQIINGRITLEKLTAKAGATRVQLAGERESFHDDAETRGELKVENLTLSAEFFEQLSPNLGNLHTELRKIQADFRPEGPLDLTWKVQAKGKELVQHGVVTLKGIALRFDHFRYPVQDVNGTLAAHVAPAGHLELLEVDLAGKASGQPVYLRGTVAGPKPGAVDVRIWGTNIPLDETLIAALHAQYQELARSLHAEGKTDFEAFIRREQGKPRFDNRYVARFHDTRLRCDAFPYPLERVRGTLEIGANHQWEVRDLFGTHKGAEVRGHGRSQLYRDGAQGTRFTVSGKHLLLDAELKTALEHSAAAGVKPAWEALQPSGRLDVEAIIDLPPEKAPPEFDVTLVARNCEVRPVFFSYVLHDLSGTIHCTRGKVELRDLHARHGGSAVRLPKGEILLKPGGGFFATIPKLEANPLLPDEDFLRALPRALQAGLSSLQLREPVSLAAELIVDMPGEAGKQPIVFWDGGVLLQNASVRLGVPFQQVSGRIATRGRYHGRLEGVVGHVQLDQAVLFDQPLRNIHSRLEVWKDVPDVLRIPELTASFFGGSLGGQARVEFGPTFRYEVDLTALQVKLEQMGRHNLRDKADLSGEAVARLYLKGEGTELSGLEGGGSIDIPNGKLYNLPLLFDLLKFLAVRWPDRTAFEEAHARFSIHGPRVQINRLELLGNVISLGGEGQMNLDGTNMELDLYAVWGRIMQMLPPSVKELPPWISKQFLKIKARGKVSDPKFEKEAVPVLVEPLKGLMQRMTK